MRVVLLFLSLFIVSCLLLLTGGLSCGNERQEEQEEQQEHEEFKEGQFLDVHIGLSLLSSLEKGLSFENVWVKTGMYKSDRCLLVRGNMNNSTSDNFVMAAAATDYNSDWERVVHTLSRARISGVAEFPLPQYSRITFEIILSWSSDVRYIEIQAESIKESLYYGPESS